LDKINQDIAREISNLINVMGIDHKKVARHLANDHPTLQQTFMNIAVQFIREMSTKTYVDLRNQYSVKLAKKIMDNLEYEDKEGILPLI
jgi:hypothetical protein